MATAVEIRPLARDDDRGGFSCGQPDLDRFFQHYAGQNQFKLHLAVTYVAVVEERIVGFATVAASALERGSVPNARLRKRLPDYPGRRGYRWTPMERCACSISGNPSAWDLGAAAIRPKSGSR